MSTPATEASQDPRQRVHELAGGRYRLTRVLASGGMSSVWLAEDVRLRRRVAVKVLSESLARDERFVERFRREVRVSARLAHPNLVPIFDFGEQPWPYLVTEYVAGGTLAERMRSERGFDGDPKRLATELLRALAHVHQAGIVHRDVTPSNVLFDEGDGRARLTDFGIAQTARDTRLTQTGMVIGTLSYIAPEVMRGEDASVRSDLFSLGVLLAEAMGEDGPAPLRRVVRRLTAHEPSARPASAQIALAMLGTGSGGPALAAAARLAAGATGAAHDDATTSALVGDATTSALVGDAMTSALVGDATTSALVGDATTSALVGDARTSPLPGDGATSALPRAATETAALPDGRAPAAVPAPAPRTPLAPVHRPPAAVAPQRIAPAPARSTVAPRVATPVQGPGSEAAATRRRAPRWARRTALVLLLGLVLAATAVALEAANLYGSHDPVKRESASALVSHELDSLQRDVRSLTR